jgi:hypothetical protein
MNGIKRGIQNNEAASVLLSAKPIGCHPNKFLRSRFAFSNPDYQPTEPFTGWEI